MSDEINSTVAFFFRGVFVFGKTLMEIFVILQMLLIEDVVSKTLSTEKKDKLFLPWFIV